MELTQNEFSFGTKGVDFLTIILTFTRTPVLNLLYSVTPESCHGLSPISDFFPTSHDDYLVGYPIFPVSDKRNALVTSKP